MKKRGQVTLFVILGLVVLILVSIVIFMSQRKIDQPPIEQVFQAQYGEKLQPLANDVSFCINALGQKAFETLGSKSGYIEANSVNYGLWPEYINDGVELFQGSGVVLPYWYSIEGAPRCSNCVAKFNVPPLEGNSPRSIKSQVEKYVEDNILTCMNKFEDYKTDMDLEYGVPKATVIFRDESTFIGLNWSINAVFGDKTNSSVSVFSSVLDLEFKKIYDLSLDILGQMELYDQDKKLERFTTDVITLMSLGGKEAIIPPIEGPSISTIDAPKIWNLRESKQLIKEGISENLNYMQVVGSRDSFIATTNDSYFDSIYSSFQNVLYTDEEFLSKTRVRFDYQPNWPLYVNVNPGFGEIAMPNSDVVNLLFFQMGMTRYKFSYDVTYPVVVSLEEPTAFGDKGYTFQYAYEVNIRNNKEYSNETIFLNQSQFYDETSDQTSSGFNAPDQRTIPVNIKVYDGYTLDPLDEFSVVYTCMDNVVVVGSSEMKEGQAVINTMLPPCIGGYFSTLDVRYGFDHYKSELVLSQDYDFDFFVYPEKNVTVKPVKRTYSPRNNMPPLTIDFDRGWKIDSTSYDIDVAPMQDEEVYLIFTKLVDGVPSDSYIKFARVNYPDVSAELELTPGQYKVDVTSILYLGENYSRNNITIPSTTYHDVGASLFTSGEDVTIPEISFNSSIYLGGIALDDTVLDYLTISSENIQEDKDLRVFYPALNPSFLLFMQDLDVYSKIQSAGTDYPDLFKAAFEEN